LYELHYHQSCKRQQRLGGPRIKECDRINHRLNNSLMTTVPAIHLNC
jgi:hypothetical protein